MTGNDRELELLQPDEYQELVKSVQFREVYFQQGSWKINRDILGEQNSIEVGFETGIEEEDAKHVVFNQHFRLRVKPEKGRRVAISVDCHIVTECHSEIEQSSQFWNTYREITLPVISVPFFREHVYNLSGKMGVPPILVPHWVR